MAENKLQNLLELLVTVESYILVLGVYTLHKIDSIWRAVDRKSYIWSNEDIKRKALNVNSDLLCCDIVLESDTPLDKETLNSLHIFFIDFLSESYSVEIAPMPYGKDVHTKFRIIPKYDK